jgi:hypothetical protein
MQGKKRALFVALSAPVMAVVAIAAIVFINVTRAGAANSSGSPIPMDPTYLTRVANGTPTMGDGVPAITPYLKGNGPTFTTDDARAFVTKYGLPRMDIQGPINVVVAVFGNASQLELQYVHTDFGVSSDRLVCFVEILNTITISNPHGKLISFSHGFVNFDAYTGNELDSGAFN